jgi:uncharacterized protein YegL
MSLTFPVKFIKDSELCSFFNGCPNDFDFKFELEFDQKVGEITSNVVFNRNENYLTIEGILNTSTIVLQMKSLKSFQTSAVYNGQYLSLTIFPENDSIRSVDVAEYVFVIDCSGSMSGNEIEMAKDSLQIMMHSIPQNSFFNIVRFGSRFECFSKDSVQKTENNFQSALNYINSIEANLGGTELKNPLDFVFEQPTKIQNQQRRVFVLTDGCVFDREVVFGSVRLNSQNNCVFCLGIGYGADSELVKGIAKFGNGDFDFVLNCSDLRLKALGLLNNSIKDRPTDINVHFENNEVQIVPFPIISPSWNTSKTYFAYSSNSFDQNSAIFISICSPLTSFETVIYPTEINDTNCLKALFGLTQLHDLQSKLLFGDLDRKIQKEMIQISISSGILCEFTGLIGVGQKVREANTSNYIEEPKAKINYHYQYNPRRRPATKSTGGCTPRPTPPPPSPTPYDVPNRILDKTNEIDLLLTIVQNHGFDGFWRNSNEILQKLQIQVTIPKGIEILPDEVISTTIVLSFLRTNLKSIETAWSMMYSQSFQILSTRFPEIQWENIFIELENSIIPN